MNRPVSPSQFGSSAGHSPQGPGRGVPLKERLLAPVYHWFLSRMDARIGMGSLRVHTPDGRVRTLGGRGEGVQVEVVLNRWRALNRLMSGGSVGWYEAWQDQDWRSDDLTGLFTLFMANRRQLMGMSRGRGPSLWRHKRQHSLNDNHRDGAKRNILAHYDLGNDFYSAWLDETMTYSSACFADIASPAEVLADAQRRKIGLLLDRLHLRPGQRLLEIGCGWGSLAAEAHRRGAEVTAITLSPSQAEWARKNNPGPNYQLVDYRDVQGQFDAVVSCEMVEAVGQPYWGEYIQAIARALRPGGRAALQLITIDDEIFPIYARGVDFIQAYVFPGGCLISEATFAELARQSGLSWQDRDGFGLHYAETLRVWRDRFDEAMAGGRLPPRFDDVFARFWRFYLSYCEGGFRSGGIDAAQVTMVKG